ncbi:hypothetical protein N836_34110 [Leptolyngbya sp. Heron Island J]|uniref:hypothetical protein n=1 Tax=Leptolyngbya sp. Heron Island J TaxID=1385935 RepID=UPI0003B9CD84|nr:hypothetical protein [Leptolyngbya sp. Heron Island J]ESA37858.1 hypothetical protein N836_35145 [Leptolyngbya sp. Heron Island J]ESA38114.1 hypothetical protein N836_34110 [Leptolyngbya sp. Heron Island J]
MVWQYAGQAQVSGSVLWSIPIPVFGEHVRLTYSSTNPTVLNAGFRGYMRVKFTDQNIVSNRWLRIWPKPQSEMVVMSPWEPDLGRHEVQFKSSRYVPVDGWSVVVEYWVPQRDPIEDIVEDIDLLVDDLVDEYQEQDLNP